ncbi:MAG: Hsp20/alpha crystallin family protein [Halobacteriota archaeon]
MSITGPFDGLTDKIIKKVAKTLAQAEREFYKGLMEDSAKEEKSTEKTFDGLKDLWQKNKGEQESEDSTDNLRVKTRSRSKTQNLGGGKDILVDIFEDQEVITIVAGLPGVEKEDINIFLEDSKLKIKAGRYFKEIKLPKKVKEDPVETDFRNGVLTLKFEVRG